MKHFYNFTAVLLMRGIIYVLNMSRLELVAVTCHNKSVIQLQKHLRTAVITRFHNSAYHVSEHECSAVI